MAGSSEHYSTFSRPKLAFIEHPQQITRPNNFDKHSERGRARPRGKTRVMISAMNTPNLLWTGNHRRGKRVSKRSIILIWFYWTKTKMRQFLHSSKIKGFGFLYNTSVSHCIIQYLPQDFFYHYQCFSCDNVYQLFVCLFVCLFIYFFFILGPYSEENLSIPLFFHMAQSQNTTSKLHYQ